MSIFSQVDYILEDLLRKLVLQLALELFERLYSLALLDERVGQDSEKYHRLVEGLLRVNNKRE